MLGPGPEFDLCHLVASISEEGGEQRATRKIPLLLDSALCRWVVWTMLSSELEREAVGCPVSFVLALQGEVSG
jgi:hypothetical protein